jgi:DNA-binding transcriptional MerR regulator
MIQFMERQDQSSADWVTSKDLMEAAQVTGVNTLRNWCNNGLLPEPEIRTHPNGRGKIAYWPAWVRIRCERIRDLRAAGKTRSQIAAILEQDGGDEKDQRKLKTTVKRRYRFAEVMKRSEFDKNRLEFRESLTSSLIPTISTTLEQVSSPRGHFSQELLDEGIALMKEGLNPVLVLQGTAAYVCSDIAISQILSRLTSPDELITVIPIAESIAEIVPEVMSVMKDARVLPKPVVSKGSGDQKVDFDVSVGKKGKVKIGAARRKES